MGPSLQPLRCNPDSKKLSFTASRLRAAAVIAAMALPALAATTGARAGTVLLSRDSFIHATGSDGGFNMSDGTTEFGRFANDINNEETSGSNEDFAEAHQNSQPGLIDQAFQGAFAEGSVEAKSNGSAQSTFNLTFEVQDHPQSFTFGAAMGIGGDGTAICELLPLAAGAGGPEGPPAIFKSALAPGVSDSSMLDKNGILMPGTYTLKVHADTNDSGEDASAYYNINLTLANVAAAPLPPAAWSGFGVLAAMCPLIYFSQSRKKILIRQVA